MPLRMLDYWVRLRRKFPNKKIHQVVIYLRPTNSPLASQNIYTSDKTQHEFQIIRMWEQSPQVLKQYQGLLPFIVLCQTTNPEEELKQVAQQIEAITDKEILREGKAETANQIALNTLLSGITVDLIAQFTGLSIEQIQKLQ